MTDRTETQQGAGLIGRTCRARTQTAGGQTVRVEVTKVEAVGPAGVEVWGYRLYPRRARVARQTAIPRRYFIPTDWLPADEQGELFEAGEAS